MADDGSNPKKVDLPFTVAITGHRQLSPEASERVETRIVAILRDLRQQITARAAASELDRQRDISFRFLSAVAEGADQIGARAAMATGWDLHVLLPFRTEAYLQTFNDPGSPELARMLAAAQRVQVLADWEVGAQDSTDSWQEWWVTRRYRTVGQLLISQADLMIAVWRGTAPAGVGGTAEVIAEALRLGVPLIWIDPDRQDTVVSIVGQDEISRSASIFDVSRTLEASAPHGGHDAAVRAALASLFFGELADAAQAEGYLYRERTDGRTRHSLYAFVQWLLLLGMRSANDARAPLRSWQGLVLNVESAWTLPAPDISDCDDANDSPLEQPACAADRIATRLGHTYRSAYFAVFGLAALAVLLALLGLWPNLNRLKPWFVIGELASLGLAIAVWASAYKRQLHRRWLDSRQIGESLRGARILSWIGFAGRHNGGGPPAWSAAYADAAAAQAGIAAGAIDNRRLATLAARLRALVKDQAAYHQINHDRLRAFHGRLDLAGIIAVSAAAAVSLTYLVISRAVHDHDHPLYLAASAAAAFFGGVGPALAAAIAGIRYHGDFERFAERSRESGHSLDIVANRLTQFTARLAQRGDVSRETESPLFEEFVDICMAAQKVIEGDLKDWRFNFSARPMPLP